MPRRVFAAVDIGASGGRVMAGVVEDGTVSLRPIHRFPNGLVEAEGHLRWPVSTLFEGVVAGLGKLASEFPDVESIGVDTWGVDYALLDGDGLLVDQPIAYRDDRTSRVIDHVHGIVDTADLYAINGQQFLPFNTLYQLVADQRSGRLGRAAHVVLLPDLIAFWLTGELRTEVTNASTTGLVDARSGQWSSELLARLGIPAGLLPPLEQPGEVRGAVQEDLRRGSDCHPRPSSRRWARTTPRRQSWQFPPATATSPTSRVARGRWSGWSSTVRSSQRPAGRPTSRTRAASIGGRGSCATRAGCGCCRSRCERGPKRANRRTLGPCSLRPPSCRRVVQ